jgi:hypothetical protein
MPAPGPGRSAPIPTWSYWWWTRTRPWCWPTAMPSKQGAAGPIGTASGSRPAGLPGSRGCAREPLARLLRPGNAAPGAADDLIALVDPAVAQLPVTPGEQRVLVRSDSAAANTRLAWHLRDQGSGSRWACRSTPMCTRRSWPNPSMPGRPVDPDGQVRPGAEVVELTGWIDLGNWPPGTRAICRRALGFQLPVGNRCQSRCSGHTSGAPGQRLHKLVDEVVVAVFSPRQ